MNRTEIEWVKNPDGTQGFTSNPVRGKCPVGCTYCYAEKIRLRYKWSEKLSFHKEELNAIKSRKKPAGIFIGSMIELWHDATIGVMPEIMTTINDCPQHRFYLLTKQPQNLLKFSPFPSNCWVGVTATDPSMIREAFKNLKDIEAKVKYISFEPLQGMIFGGDHNTIELFIKDSGVNWVIIGAQTKPYKPPKIEWVQEIVEACDKAGVPVFLKDNLLELVNYQSPETVFAFDKDGYYRQEMPNKYPIDRL